MTEEDVGPEVEGSARADAVRTARWPRTCGSLRTRRGGRPGGGPRGRSGGRRRSRDGAFIIAPRDGRVRADRRRAPGAVRTNAVRGTAAAARIAKRGPATAVKGGAPPVAKDGQGAVRGDVAPGGAVAGTARPSSPLAMAAATRRGTANVVAWVRRRLPRRRWRPPAFPVRCRDCAHISVGTADARAEALATLPGRRAHHRRARRPSRWPRPRAEGGPRGRSARDCPLVAAPPAAPPPAAAPARPTGHGDRARRGLAVAADTRIGRRRAWGGPRHFQYYISLGLHQQQSTYYLPGSSLGIKNIVLPFYQDERLPGLIKWVYLEDVCEPAVATSFDSTKTSSKKLSTSTYAASDPFADQEEAT